MDFSELDAQIADWARRHRLVLQRNWGERECRFAYLSSVAGECFQIFVDPPVDGRVSVYAAGIEGRRDNDEPRKWEGPAENVGALLETAIKTVTEWMLPSERYYSADAPAP
jgi:hypothetical protein